MIIIVSYNKNIMVIYIFEIISITKFKLCQEKKHNCVNITWAKVPLL